MRNRAVIVFVVLVTATSLAVWSAVFSRTDRSTGRLDALHILAHGLEDGGMIYRSDVVIRVSGIAAAWGFSTPGCHGVVLVTILPETAQSWSHISPMIDGPEFKVTYLYRDVDHDDVPRFARMRDQLLHRLNNPEWDQRFAVIGLAEQGQCGLAGLVLQLLHKQIDAPVHEPHRQEWRPI
jgi:hypothetical protein